MGATNHKERAHALLSASGASRWMNCTPSARLEEDIRDKDETSFAAEGTLAHEFADIGLRLANDEITSQKFEKEYAALVKNDLYAPEMDEEVSKYVSMVVEEFSKAKANTPGAVLLIEQKIDLTEYIPEGGGTNDAIIIADGVMTVIDLKYGKGIKVHSDNNPQLMLYGLGALNKYDLSYDIYTVKLMIIQPRLDNYSSWDISADDLRDWGENEVKVKAKIAFAGDGETCAGDWCKWCKVKPRCKAVSEKVMDAAKFDFATPKTLSDEELLEVYAEASTLLEWVNSVTLYIQDEALAGKKWPGYKLVEGRSNRVWGQPYLVHEALSKMVEDGEIEHITDIQETKLKGITAITKLLGKDKFNDILGEWVVKPAGKPTLVPESDKRQALGVDQAKEDFKS